MIRVTVEVSPHAAQKASRPTSARPLLTSGRPLPTSPHHAPPRRAFWLCWLGLVGLGRLGSVGFGWADSWDRTWCKNKLCQISLCVYGIHVAHVLCILKVTFRRWSSGEPAVVRSKAHKAEVDRAIDTVLDVLNTPLIVDGGTRK